MNHCDTFQKVYEGKTVEQLPILKECLLEISRDYMNWVSVYECKVCKQKWKEVFEEKGHGEVPKVKKIN